jgi:hypothetical protein
VSPRRLAPPAPVAAAWLSLVALLAGGCDDGAGPDDEEGIEVVASVDAVVRVDSGRSPISPYIYGSNQDHPETRWTVRRWGGNRTTGYNWETNFSSAGADWNHSSDLWILTSAGLPESDAAIPAIAMRHFHEQSLGMGAESILTLQMAGFVAADGAGPVAEEETAPSGRWVPVVFAKPSPPSSQPDLEDGVVYMDELVSRMVATFGGAGSGGVRWYSLDNEPALWPHTHPRIHPDPLTVAELMDRTIALATAVKDVDPEAGILGPVLYGMTAFLSLQEAPDWARVGAGYDWFVPYYLDRMRQASREAGRRLVDALDVHWYPEARGDHRITDPAATTPADVEARLQAPRSLWDPTYTEDSWIATWLGDYLPILPRLTRAIEAHYPGTGLAITEYDYGGGSTISGGLAQADVLGAFGRHGVDIATLWGIEDGDRFQAAAFRLYRDYDGAGGTFGSTSVPAAAGDPADLSIWAALEEGDATPLHLILINKNPGGLEANIQLRGAPDYSSARAWGFGPGAPTITERPGLDRVDGNAFSHRIPGRTAIHLVLQ